MSHTWNILPPAVKRPARANLRAGIRASAHQHPHITRDAAPGSTSQRARLGTAAARGLATTPTASERPRAVQPAQHRPRGDTATPYPSKQQSPRDDCFRREATARCDVAGLGLLLPCTSAAHDEVAYAKRESSPRPAGPAIGDERGSDYAGLTIASASAPASQWTTATAT